MNKSEAGMGEIEDWINLYGRVSFESPAAVVEPVQRALRRSGASLVADGEFGPITEQAIKRFQAAHWIIPRGWVGVSTGHLLDETEGDEGTDAPSVKAAAPWLSYMRAISGTKEIPGAANSPIIIAWSKDIAAAYPEEANYARMYTHDATPWCGLTMRWVMSRSGIKGPWGPGDTDRWLYALAWARSWAGAQRLARPIVGCVMVFKRSGGGHVTLLEEMDGADACYVRGGNQSDMINVEHRSMDGFVGAYWPPGRQPPAIELASDTASATSGGSEA